MARRVGAFRPLLGGGFVDGESGGAVLSTFWGVFVDGGAVKAVPSTFWGVFVDGEAVKAVPSTFWGDFVDGGAIKVVPSTFRGVFVDGEAGRVRWGEAPGDLVSFEVVEFHVVFDFAVGAFVEAGVELRVGADELRRRHFFDDFLKV